jgi:hypothetical protein
MPRIPTHQIDDDWEDPDEFNIEHDDPRDRLGRKMPRDEREREVERRERQWRKRHKDDY